MAEALLPVAVVGCGNLSVSRLLGEAVNVMRDEVANAIAPVGWPPLRETLAGTISHGIPLHI